MEIRKAEQEGLRQLIPIYKKAFEKHNVFEKPEEEIVEYMENRDGEWLVAEEDSRIVGGLLLAYDIDKPEHKLARFKHIAVSEEHRGKGIGSALLKKAEEIVKQGKIELHVSENEEEAKKFYEKNGYEVEGELKSHYRPKETCYIMGKVMGE